MDGSISRTRLEPSLAARHSGRLSFKLLATIAVVLAAVVGSLLGNAAATGQRGRDW